MPDEYPKWLGDPYPVMIVQNAEQEDLVKKDQAILETVADAQGSHIRFVGKKPSGKK